MHAAHYGDNVWGGVGGEWYARLHGRPVPVRVVEDPEGTHKGWIDARDEVRGDDRPGLICRKEIFEIQFPYGSQAEIDHGRGRAVLLRIERIEDEG